MQGKRRIEFSLTSSARKELQTVDVPEDRAIRIDAELSGCCGFTYTLKLIVDELRRDDIVIYQAPLRFFIDQFTRKYVGDALVLDYDSGSGYTLTNKEEAFVCQASFGGVQHSMEQRGGQACTKNELPY